MTQTAAPDPQAAELPLFPLHTVLLPGGPLQLQIFEPRYVDMVGRCMRTGTAVGVVRGERYGHDRHQRAHHRFPYAVEWPAGTAVPRRARVPAALAQQPAG